MSKIKKKRRIALVTTARSDYNTMYPVMRMAQEDPEIDHVNFVAGMHLVERFGNTWRQLERDGIEISAKVDFFSEDDTNVSLSNALGKGVAAFTEALTKYDPDIILVSGDRIENLSLFVAASALRIPIAHMCGGDITEGAFDNQIRHTMTKLSHLHFVSMPEHARRVIQMGEEPWRVTLTGDAAIDILKETRVMSRAELEQKEGIPSEGDLLLTTFHPQTLGEENAAEQYANVLDVLAEIPEIPVMIYPNIDPGFEELIHQLEAFQVRRPDAKIRKSFDRQSFYSLMAHAKFMLGNSSSGLWEAPSFKLPAINVGLRQAGRKRAENVIDVSGLDKSKLRDAVAMARSFDFKETLEGIRNPYGEGNASALTLKTLKEIKLDTKLTLKKFHEISDVGTDVERIV